MRDKNEQGLTKTTHMTPLVVFQPKFRPWLHIRRLFFQSLEALERVETGSTPGEFLALKEHGQSLNTFHTYNISKQLMILLTPTQDFVDDLIMIAQDFPEDALTIHQSVEQIRDLVPLSSTGVLQLPIGYEVLYASRSTTMGDIEVLLGRIQRVLH